MKKVLLCWGVLLALAAPAAVCAQGLELAWDNCNGPANKSDPDCETNDFLPYILILSASGMPALSQFNGASAVVQVVTDKAVMSPWWRRDKLVPTEPQCMTDFTGYSSDFTTGPFGCRNPWGPGGTGGGQWAPYDSNKRAKVQIAFALTAPRSVGAGHWYLFKLVLLPDSSPARCAGCLDRACLYFESAQVTQPAGVGDVRINSPGVRNHVTWQGYPSGAGGTDCPGVTPTLKGTWGSVKALYR